MLSEIVQSSFIPAQKYFICQCLFTLEYIQLFWLKSLGVISLLSQHGQQSHQVAYCLFNQMIDCFFHNSNVNSLNLFQGMSTKELESLTGDLTLEPLGLFSKFTIFRTCGAGLLEVSGLSLVLMASPGIVYLRFFANKVVYF